MNDVLKRETIEILRVAIARLQVGVGQTQWAVIVIKKGTHTLRDYLPCETRQEARAIRRAWKEVNKNLLHTHRVYIGRTHEF